MVFLILTAIVTLGFCVWYICDSWSEGVFSILGGIIMILCLAALIAMFGCLFPSVCQDPMSDQILYEKDIDIPLEALADNVGAEGHFYIGFGYAKEKLKYYYCFETVNGKKIKSVSSDEALIVYSSETPRIERYSARGFRTFWGYIFNIPLTTYYKIYVPEGTIQNQFVIDMK